MPRDVALKQHLCADIDGTAHLAMSPLEFMSCRSTSIEPNGRNRHRLGWPRVMTMLKD